LNKIRELGLPIRGCRVDLASKDAGVYKRTLLCRTGKFDGMFGQVVVDEPLLQKMAAHYNNQRSKPQNENDYAPILTDHNRSVDLIKGRLMAGLTVEPWKNPEEGEDGFGLYGDLRVDLPDAVEKVDKGSYSQVSLSFDEETGEIFEVSFVAVEAARRAQVLQQGENKMDFEKKYNELSTTHSKVLSRVNVQKSVRSAACASLSQNIEASKVETIKALEMVNKIMLSLKTAALSSQFKGLVKQGKVSLAEFKTIKIAEFAVMPKAALTAILSSYEARPVNKDFITYGQADAKPIDLSAGVNSPEKIRELIALQKSGKTLKSLAEGDPEKKEGADGNKPAGEEGDKKKPGEDEGSDLKFADMDEAMKALEEMEPVIGKVKEYMKTMGEQTSKLSESDKEDESGDNKEGDKK